MGGFGVEKWKYNLGSKFPLSRHYQKFSIVNKCLSSCFENGVGDEGLDGLVGWGGRGGRSVNRI